MIVITGKKDTHSGLGKVLSGKRYVGNYDSKQSTSGHTYTYFECGSDISKPYSKIKSNEVCKRTKLTGAVIGKITGSEDNDKKVLMTQIVKQNKDLFK